MAKTKSSATTATKLICSNKKASRNFNLMDRIEAGLVLQGTEVKSIRNGDVQINDAYAHLKDGEIWLINMNIAPYSHGNRYNHEPLRTRKLLVHKHQIRKLTGSIVEKGLTLIPVKLYWLKGRVKVELALAKGKTKSDQRQSIRKRDAKKEMDYARKRKL